MFSAFIVKRNFEFIGFGAYRKKVAEDMGISEGEWMNLTLEMTLL